MRSTHPPSAQAKTGRCWPVLLATLLASALSCTSSARPKPLAPEACTVSRAEPAAPDTLTFVVTEGLDLTATTRPGDASQRMLLGLMDEPGFWLHCLGAGDAAHARVGRDRIGNWPVGTGTYSPVRSANGQISALVPTAGLRAQHIKLRVHAGGDERDALDSGADLMVTTATQTTTYARVHPDFDVVPLPWNRTYVYLSASARSSTAAPQLAHTLARDAVPTEARPSPGPYWWLPERACREPAKVTAVPATRRTNRVVYDASDPVARAIAERLVALADTRAAAAPAELTDHFGDLVTLPQPPRATAMARDDLLASLTSGVELGWVLALPLPAYNGCPENVSPLGEVPWATGETIVPLIDTRAHLIVRRGSASIVLGGDGRIRILPRDAP